jgi:hypothetical protein
MTEKKAAGGRTRPLSWSLSFQDSSRRVPFYFSHKRTETLNLGGSWRRRLNTHEKKRWKKKGLMKREVYNSEQIRDVRKM